MLEIHDHLFILAGSEFIIFLGSNQPFNSFLKNVWLSVDLFYSFTLVQQVELLQYNLYFNASFFLVLEKVYISSVILSFLLIYFDFIFYQYCKKDTSFIFYTTRKHIYI
jgi:hypothetical protein